MTVPKRAPPKKPETAATATSMRNRKDQGDEYGRAMNDADLRLKIELIPRPLWGQNLRTIMGTTQWRRLTVMLDKEKPCCAICGSLQGPLQAHEEWDYEEGKSSGVATLKRVNRVCQDCHSIHHIGRTQKRLMSGVINWATWDRLIAHFLRVNDCDMATWERHGREARLAWKRRSSMTWTIEFQSYFQTAASEMMRPQ
jgi:hypothetical protein